MNLHRNSPDRRKTAHQQANARQGLAWPWLCFSVNDVAGVFIPAPVTDHLFRTPSLIGQVLVSDADLPDFFCHRGLSGNRQGSAYRFGPCAYGLRNGAGPDSYEMRAKQPKKGRAGCTQNGYGWCWRYVADWPHAAIRSANRHFMVPAREPSHRPLSVGTCLPAPPSVRPATLSIVSRIQASADPSITGRPGDRALTEVHSYPAGRFCRRVVGVHPPSQNRARMKLRRNAPMPVPGTKSSRPLRNARLTSLMQRTTHVQ